MVPGAPSSSDSDVDRVGDSNLVDDPWWFEGRLPGGGGWIFSNIPQV